jgi:hypothetical protein
MHPIERLRHTPLVADVGLYHLRAQSRELPRAIRVRTAGQRTYREPTSRVGQDCSGQSATLSAGRADHCDHSLVCHGFSFVLVKGDMATA